jgi:superfamily II helicase
LKAKDPTENVESMKRLSAELIALSAVINNKEEFSSKLRSLLVFVYSNDLIPGFSKVTEAK